MEDAAARRRRTPEERAAALREMEADARYREQHKAQQVEAVGSRDEEKEWTRKAGKSFIQEMTKQAHDGSMSLSERLRQNRSTHQKTHESFL